MAPMTLANAIKFSGLKSYSRVVIDAGYSLGTSKLALDMRQTSLSFGYTNQVGRYLLPS